MEYVPIMLSSKNFQHNNFNYLPLCQMWGAVSTQQWEDDRKGFMLNSRQQWDRQSRIQCQKVFPPNKKSALYCCFSGFPTSINPNLCGVHIHEPSWKAESPDSEHDLGLFLNSESNLSKIRTHDWKKLLYVAVSKI